MLSKYANWFSNVWCFRQQRRFRRRGAVRLRLSSRPVEALIIQPAVELVEPRRMLSGIAVNSLTDDMTPGDGLVTLREAIFAANNDAPTDLGQIGDGADTISFSAALFAGGDQAINLSIVGDTTVGPSAFAITSPITINGPDGDHGLTIARAAMVSNLRLFHIFSAGNLTLNDLTLRDGRAIGANGANGSFPGSVGGTGSMGNGGAIFNEGMLTIQGSFLTGNIAQGGSGGMGGEGSFEFGNGGLGGLGGIGGVGQGGAIFNATGANLSLSHSLISGNSARGGAGGMGGEGTSIFQGGGNGGNGGDGALGAGGAIFNQSMAALTVTDSTISGNTALGGSGGQGGWGTISITFDFFNGTGGNGSHGLGGAIYNATDNAIIVSHSNLSENSAQGGDSGPSIPLLDLNTFGGVGGDGRGGAIFNASALDCHDSILDRNTAIGGFSGESNSSAGNGQGGAIYSGSSGNLAVTRSTLSGNTAQGGSIDYYNQFLGGNGQGGAIFGETFGNVSVTQSTLSTNAARGGTGGFVNYGGSGEGGAVFNAEADLSVTNSTVSGNTAQGGSGIESGVGKGGGVFSQSNSRQLGITNSTLAFNAALDSTNIATVSGGRQVFSLGNTTINNSILGQSDTTAEDYTGVTYIAVGTNNLIRTFSGFDLTVPTITDDPLLAALSNNGGPTQTMALNIGSPAIGAGNDAAAIGLTTDQRGLGFPRMIGPHVDIGALESSFGGFPPSINGFDTAIHYTENGTAVPLEADVTVTDSDSANFDTGVLTINLSTNSDSADHLEIRNQGGEPGQVGVIGTNVTFGGTTIGTFSGGVAGAPLVITLNANATTVPTSWLLRNITFRTITENPSTLTRTVNVALTDGDGTMSNVQSKLISVSAINDAPFLSGIGVPPLTYVENDPPTSVTTSLVANDFDNTHIASAAVKISANYAIDQDILSFVNTPNITGSWNAPTGVLTLTGLDTSANYQSALRAVKYRNTSNNPSTLPRTILARINDGQINSNVVARTINVVSINDQPSLTGIESAPLSYFENVGPTSVTSTVVVSDPDNSHMVSARVKIATNYANGQDVLSFANTPNIIGSWDASSGTMILTGTDTKANYTAALRAVKYHNTSEAPSTLPRTVFMLVNDGVINSAVVSRVINVTGINDSPVLGGVEPSTLTYHRGSPPVSITSTIVATDLDNNTLVGARIKIGTNYQLGADILSFVNTVKINGVWDPASGTLVLSGTDTVDNYRTALRNVKFRNTSATPSTLTRTVFMLVNDGNINSNVVSRNIAVTSGP